MGNMVLGSAIRRRHETSQSRVFFFESFELSKNLLLLPKLILEKALVYAVELLAIKKLAFNVIEHFFLCQRKAKLSLFVVADSIIEFELFPFAQEIGPFCVDCEKSCERVIGEVFLKDNKLALLQEIIFPYNFGNFVLE